MRWVLVVDCTLRVNIARRYTRCDKRMEITSQWWACKDLILKKSSEYKNLGVKEDSRTWSKVTKLEFQTHHFFCSSEHLFNLHGAVGFAAGIGSLWSFTWDNKKLSDHTWKRRNRDAWPHFSYNRNVSQRAPKKIVSCLSLSQDGEKSVENSHKLGGLSNSADSNAWHGLKADLVKQAF